MLFALVAFAVLPMLFAFVTYTLAHVVADLVSESSDNALAVAMNDNAEWLRTERTRKPAAFRPNRPPAEFRLYA